MKLYLKIIMVILFFVIYASTMFMVNVKIHSEPKPEPCQFPGVTIIEYGVGVTNCGDTIAVEMPGDLYREYDHQN